MIFSIIFVFILLFYRNNIKKDFCLDDTTIENSTTESTTIDNEISDGSSYNQNTFYSKDEQLEILKDYYGEWLVVDDVETNKYGAVSKDYTKNEIYSSILIGNDGIKIDGCNINNLVVVVEYADDYYMTTHYKTNMKQFGFSSDKYKIFEIRKGSDGYSDVSFSFITDGESCYYYYLGTYFKMVKK